MATSGRFIPYKVSDGSFIDWSIPISGDDGKAFVWNDSLQKHIYTLLETAGAAIENHKYRMDVSFQSGGNTLVVPVLIKGIR